MPRTKPTPYYHDDYVTLYHADSLEHTYLWDSADVLVTDPPYGMAYVSNSSKIGPSDRIKGDDTPDARDAMIHHWGTKPALIFGTWRVPRPQQAKMTLVWDKGESPGMGDLAIPWGPSWEEIYVLGNGFTGKRAGGGCYASRESAQAAMTGQTIPRRSLYRSWSNCSASARPAPSPTPSPGPARRCVPRRTSDAGPSASRSKKNTARSSPGDSRRKRCRSSRYFERERNAQCRETGSPLKPPAQGLSA